MPEELVDTIADICQQERQRVLKALTKWVLEEPATERAVLDRVVLTRREREFLPAAVAAVLDSLEDPDA